MALFDVGVTDVTLLPLDTTGTPAGATQAATQALQSGAQLMIGPVFSAEVSAVTPLTRQRGLPLLALSNNKQLAGRDVYILGQSPDAQVVRVLDYARQKQLLRVAALLPASAFGDSIESSLQEQVQAKGMSLGPIERVAPGADPALVAASFSGALSKAGGADVILLGESAARAPLLARALREAGVSTRFLGTAQWDSITPEPALAGSWFAAIPSSLRQSFQNRYQQTYSAPPTPIASLAYDATALAAVLSRAPERFARAQLQRATGFAGTDGIFRLNANGTVSRGLAVYELRPEGIRIIDQAPVRFTDGAN